MEQGDIDGSWLTNGNYCIIKEEGMKKANASMKLIFKVRKAQVAVSRDFQAGMGRFFPRSKKFEMMERVHMYITIIVESFRFKYSTYNTTNFY